jgi:hypothetical protein
MCILFFVVPKMALLTNCRRESAGPHTKSYNFTAMQSTQRAVRSESLLNTDNRCNVESTHEDQGLARGRSRNILCTHASSPVATGSLAGQNIERQLLDKPLNYIVFFILKGTAS